MTVTRLESSDQLAGSCATGWQVITRRGALRRNWEEGNSTSMACRQAPSTSAGLAPGRCVRCHMRGTRPSSDIFALCRRANAERDILNESQSELLRRDFSVKTWRASVLARSLLEPCLRYYAKQQAGLENLQNDGVDQRQNRAPLICAR
jgi:hypothetical protein